MFFLKKKPSSKDHKSSTPEGMRLYAIGDVHGRADLLIKLLQQIEQERREPALTHRVIFLGDYVDRGHDSSGVIDLLLSYAKKYPDSVFLKGNHEEAMLDFLATPDSMEHWIDWGGHQTLESYGIQQVVSKTAPALRDQLVNLLPDPHFKFLLGLERYHQLGDYVFVHAGLRPGIELSKQTDRDLLWIRKEFLNCGPKQFSKFCVVHGHTPQDREENLSWRINVDTAAYTTGRLTATVLEGTHRRFISTS